MMAGASFFARQDGLLRCPRNDSAARWIASRSLSSGAIRATCWLAMTARASIVRRCDRNTALAGIELKWPAISTVRLKRILDASRTQNSANWNRGHFCNLRSWTIMKFSQKVPAALATLAVALCLGTAPVKAQFVCANTAFAGDGANATGSAGNFACGTNANAAGTGSSNTAIGNNSQAQGNDSSN